MDEQNKNEQQAGASFASSPTPSEAQSAAPEPSLARIPTRSSNNRLQTIITLGVLAVVVLVILGTLTPLKGILTQRVSSPTPTPVPTLIPGDNQFYIATGPAWGTVSIDGHPLSRLPVFGQDPPLQLARGTHVITWHADPFQPESCTVYVPSQVNEPCPYEDTSPGSPRMITFTASLANLPTNLRASLVAAVQAALNRFAATTTVQPGELYARLEPPQAVGTGTAQQALQASEHFYADTNPNTSRSCNIYSGVVCSSAIGPGNSNCIQFCTFTTNFEPSGAQPGAKNSTAWETMGMFYSTWDYSTPGGQAVAKGQPDTTMLGNVTNDYPIFFDIRWINQQWQVSINNTSPSFFAGTQPVSQNSACQSIHDQAKQVLDLEGWTGTRHCPYSFPPLPVSVGKVHQVPPKDREPLSLPSCFLFGHLLQWGEHEIWHTCVLSAMRGKVRKALCQKFMPLLIRKVEWACVRKALFAMFSGELRVERTRMVS